ncbi:MAG TPA: hypothetical protein VH951_10660 [Dehalococcoidia bacterium]|jgi:hypothetical protein
MQDWVFLVGSFVLAAGVVPMLMTDHPAPPYSSSVPTCLVLTTFALTFGSLGLWASAAGLALQGVLWAGLIFKRRLARSRTDQERLARS